MSNPAHAHIINYSLVSRLLHTTTENCPCDVRGGARVELYSSHAPLNSRMEYELIAEKSSYQLYDRESLASNCDPGIHKAIASGYLYKLARGSSLGKVWHRRYYVLYSDGLLYSYHNARSKASHRTIPVGRLCLRMKFGKETVNGECSSWPRAVPVRQRFSLINTDRSYHFYADNDTDLGMWKQHLQSTLERLSSPSQALLDNKPNGYPTADQEGAAKNFLQDESQIEGGCQETVEEVAEGTHSDTNSAYDIYTGIGLQLQHASSSNSSEESIVYLHKTNSPLNLMLESTFGEITSFIQ